MFVKSAVKTWFDRFDGWQNEQYRYSAHFAAMLLDKVHVFCCPFYRTFILFGAPEYTNERGVYTKYQHEQTRNQKEIICYRRAVLTGQKPQRP